MAGIEQAVKDQIDILNTDTPKGVSVISGIRESFADDRGYVGIQRIADFYPNETLTATKEAQLTHMLGLEVLRKAMTAMGEDGDPTVLEQYDRILTSLGIDKDGTLQDGTPYDVYAHSVIASAAANDFTFAHLFNAADGAPIGIGITHGMAADAGYTRGYTTPEIVDIMFNDADLEETAAACRASETFYDSTVVVNSQQPVLAQTANGETVATNQWQVPLKSLNIDGETINVIPRSCYLAFAQMGREDRLEESQGADASDILQGGVAPTGFFSESTRAARGAVAVPN